MIFGGGKKEEGQQLPPNVAGGAGAFIFDAGIADFESKVMMASMQKPVIVDFWAPWCGPCKQLMPLLEKAVSAAGGDVLLAKVNIDENQQLAAALQVRSVPTVFAFFGGRPVDAFQGLVPESQIKAFIGNLVQLARQNQPDALDPAEVLAAADEAIAQGDLAGAEGLYAALLQQEPENAKAYSGIVRVLIRAGELEQAEGMIAGAPEEIAKSSALAEAKTALEMAKNRPEGDAGKLAAAVKANPKDHESRIKLAQIDFAEGRQQEALDGLLAAIEIDRNWNEQAARKELLKFFEALGHGDPLTIEARRKLSSILFS